MAKQFTPTYLLRASIAFLADSVLEIMALGTIVIAVRVIDPTTEQVPDWLTQYFGTGDTLLIAVVAVLLTVQASAATVAYIRASQVRKLGRLLNHATVVEVIKRLQRLSDYKPIAKFCTQQQLLASLSTDTKMVGLAMASLLNTVKFVVLSCVYAFALVKIDPIATLVLLPVATVAIPVSLVMARGVQASSSVFFKESSQKYSIEIRDAVVDIVAVNTPRGNTSDFDVEDRLDSSTTRGFYDNYDVVLLANERILFVSTILQAFAIAVAFGVLGHRGLSGSVSFGTVLVFLLATQRAAAAVKTLASHLTNLVRYYPLIYRYNRIYYSTVQNPVDKLSTPSAVSRLAPSSTVVVTSEPLTKFGIAQILNGFEALSFSGDETRYLFFGNLHRPSETTLAEFVGVGSNERLDEMLPDDSSRRFFKVTNERLETRSLVDVWPGINSVLKFTLLGLRAKQQRKALVLSTTIVDPIAEDDWEAIADFRESFEWYGATENRTVTTERYCAETIVATTKTVGQLSEITSTSSSDSSNADDDSIALFV